MFIFTSVSNNGIIGIIDIIEILFLLLIINLCESKLKYSPAIKKKIPEKSQMSVSKLKLSLVGNIITLDIAKRLLYYNGDTLDFLFSESHHNPIYHIFDKHNSNQPISEFIVFKHNFHDKYAVYKMLPFNQQNSYGYTVYTPKNFWNSLNFDELLVEKFIIRNAKRKIFKNVQNWINKPLCSDGKMGILCKLSWEACTSIMENGN